MMAHLKPLSRRARMRVLWNRIENCWVGDLIGAVSIFGSFWLGLVLAHAMTGGAQ